MVRTRLSDSHDDAIETFLPERRRSVKRNSRSELEEAVSTIQDGHLYHSPRMTRKRIFDLTSSSSRNSKNSESHSPVFNTRRRSYSKRWEAEDTPRARSQAAETEENDRMSRRTRRGTSARDSTGVAEEEGRFQPSRRGRRSLYSSAELNKSDLQEGGLRRSSRRKKPIYSTMDQTLLGNLQLSGGIDIYDWHAGKRSPTPEMGGKEVDDAEESKDEEEEEEEQDGDSGDNDERKNDADEELERLDMYSRVKQRHIQAKKMREQQQRMEEEERLRKKQEGEEDEEGEEEEEDGEDEEEESAEETSEDDEDSDDEEDTSEEESERETRRKNYHLRQHRAPTKRFEVPVEVRMPRRRKSELEDVFGIPNSPIRRRYSKTRKHLTPIRSPRFKRRKHHATHHSSSTSSEGSDDERKFERRKSKSMAKARMRCLPMNLTTEDVASGARRDRQKIGSSLADVDPMNIDSSVTFESVGGLNKHIQSLKEMVVFPLLYPEVFSKFKITPPRGVLFHGPPGTGKTLVARALANECRSGDKRVAFFMRKGADCLSKWVGESERQLRLLFDQAYTMRPSIIFFDEIDGLAPVRSSRQDQIHSSIVSTLLALMDGLDSRGEVVVIGATNRIDSIDPALRRPGRFDREFLFQLPSCEARQSILSIHTKEWNPKLSDSFLAEVAEKCVGYCGADLKALCTETALYALRHQFPQIYASKEKLLLDLSQIQVSARDFHLAMQNIVPAAQRAVVSPGRALSMTVRPLLQGQLNFILDKLKNTFPIAFNRNQSGSQENGNLDREDVVSDLLSGDIFDDDEGPCIFVTPTARKKRKTNDGEAKSFLNFSSSAFSAPSAFRPRVLLAGDPDQGHSTHIAPAVLHRLEGLPVHCLDLPTLYAVSAKNPEESCAQVFREARRTAPSVIYMPHVVQWWNASSYTLQATFLTMLHDLPPNSPILLLATADCSQQTIPVEISNLFGSPREVYTMRNPTSDERKEFFTELVLVEAAKAPPQRKKLAAKALEVLPAALPSEPHTLSKEEEGKLRESEEATLRELRIFLRDVLSRMAMERKFRSFAKAVDPEEVPDYFTVIKNPMDLSTMMNKINMHEYVCAKDFLRDIDLITSNALEYNPDRDPSDRQIRNYACELKDMAYAIIDAEMDSDFEQMCVDITKSRAARGDVIKTKDAPSFYRTLPQLLREQAQEAAKKNPTPRPRVTAPRPRTPGSPLRPLKKRRKSAWSRGCIPKPKKYPKKKQEEQEKDEEEDDSGDETELENVDGKEEEEEEAGREAGEETEKDNEGSEDSKTDNDDEKEEGGRSDSSKEGELQIDEGARDEEEDGNNEETQETLTNGLDGDSEEDDSESVKSAPVTGKGDSREGAEEVTSQEDNAMVNGSMEDESSREEMGNGKDESSNDGVTSERNEKNSEGEGQGSGDVIIRAADATPITTNVEVTLRRVTRRMLADVNANRALEILDEPTPDLVVDKQRLDNLLVRLVSVTSNWTVSRLEKLHCQLSQCIYRHRMDYDKTQLIQDMEDEVSQATLTAMQT